MATQRKEQHYIFSPHDHAGNLFDNAFGMSSHRMGKGKNAIKPVFKNHIQRYRFNKLANAKLKQLGKRTNENQHAYDAAEFLRSRSTFGNARFNFAFTKVSNPRVYIQGHGGPGNRSIWSDSENFDNVTAKKVAKMLHERLLSNFSEVRANSCYSGTQKVMREMDYDGRSTHLHQHFIEGTVAKHHAGNWADTFAGSLDAELHALSKARRNRVAGYMGPTSKHVEDVFARASNGQLRKERHFAAWSEDTKPYRRKDMRRYGTD